MYLNVQTCWAARKNQAFALSENFLFPCNEEGAKLIHLTAMHEGTKHLEGASPAGTDPRPIIKGSFVRNFRSYEQLDSSVKW